MFLSYKMTLSKQSYALAMVNVAGARLTLNLKSFASSAMFFDNDKRSDNNNGGMVAAVPQYPSR
jgi:hypothetical protein